MKITTYSTITIALTIIAFSMCSSSAQQPTPQQSFSTIVNPTTPSSVTLCGKQVDLDRADMYERYDRELTSMAYTHGNTLLTIKRANKYFPVMSKILKDNNVPQDLLYLACIESYLNPRAYSPAKAAGIWQFMPATAQQFGLEVSDEVDERYHLEKATKAACKYLKNSYDKYGNWESTMAAYNAGDGRITKELAAQLVDSSFDLYLVDETSRYVFRVMAMKEIIENPQKYGFSLTADQLYFPEEYTEVEVTGMIEDWPAWAKKHGITFAQLREANPWIRAKKLTNKRGKTYTVRIPNKDSLSRSKQSKPIFNPNWATNK